MKLFELLQSKPDPQNQDQNDPNQPQMQQSSGEDASGKFDANQVDDNLQDIVQNVDDENAQPDLPQGAGTEPPELDNQNTKPIDDALLGQIKNLPYATKYNFDDKSPLNPLKIAGMQLQDLSSLKNQVEYKLQFATIKNQVGNFDNDLIEYCNDLLKFINTVTTFKTSSTASQLAQYRSAPPYKKQGAANDNILGATNDNRKPSMKNVS
jgi:hypothetical protein